MNVFRRQSTLNRSDTLGRYNSTDRKTDFTMSFLVSYCYICTRTCTSTHNRPPVVHMHVYFQIISLSNSIVDKTRCRLSAIPGIDGSDYVNANFIEVHVHVYI